MSLGRRRLIRIAAAAGGLALLPNAARARDAAPVAWRGTAMGAPAAITLLHPDRAAAERLLAACVAEIHRAESLFSLFRRESWLTRLNAAGRVEGAPPDFVALVRTARAVSALSDGAFDVTIQPLWALYAGHFARAGADPDGPPADRVAEAQARVGWQRLVADDDAVRFLAPGMAASFNGIAQGWVTDRVADLLRAEGLTDLLLDLGEMRGLGHAPGGRPWRAGVADPERPGGLLAALALRDRALATSGGYGTRFDPAGRFHHLFDPASGRPAGRWASVSVLAATATIADALTKPVSLAPAEAIPALLARGGADGALVAAAGAAPRWIAAGRPG